MHRRQEESQVPLRQQGTASLNIQEERRLIKTLFETANCTLFSANSHHLLTNGSADFSHATNFKAKAKRRSSNLFGSASALLPSKKVKIGLWVFCFV